MTYDAALSYPKKKLLKQRSVTKLLTLIEIQVVNIQIFFINVKGFIDFFSRVGWFRSKHTHAGA